MRKLAIFLLSLILLLTSVRESFAVTTPSFPACPDPAAPLRVEYKQGTHGIAGDTTTYKGSDSVYNVTETTHVQCFCTEDEEGTQTNWWKVTSLTEDEIKILKNQGWIYIPNGSLWGLDNAPYMAKNSDYNCRNPRIGSSNTQESGPSVLGLADTNSITRNITVAYLLIAIGVASLIIYKLLGKSIRD